MNKVITDFRQAAKVVAITLALEVYVILQQLKGERVDSFIRWLCLLLSVEDVRAEAFYLYLMLHRPDKINRFDTSAIVCLFLAAVVILVLNIVGFSEAIGKNVNLGVSFASMVVFFLFVCVKIKQFYCGSNDEDACVSSQSSSTPDDEVLQGHEDGNMVSKADDDLEAQNKGNLPIVDDQVEECSVLPKDDSYNSKPKLEYIDSDKYDTSKPNAPGPSDLEPALSSLSHGSAEIRRCILNINIVKETIPKAQTLTTPGARFEEELVILNNQSHNIQGRSEVLEDQGLFFSEAN